MTQASLEALLGRSLTSNEVDNLDLYLDIATNEVSDLTCLNLKEGIAERSYGIRANYSTVFTDMFTNPTSVVLDDKELLATEYSARQWENRNAEWFNSIVLDTLGADEVKITATWGIFDQGLNLLVARLFGLMGKVQSGTGRVKSKKVEDFSVTFEDRSERDQFLLDNHALIQQYSMCNIGLIRHGKAAGALEDHYEYHGIR